MFILKNFQTEDCVGASLVRTEESASYDLGQKMNGGALWIVGDESCTNKKRPYKTDMYFLLPT